MPIYLSKTVCTQSKWANKQTQKYQKFEDEKIICQIVGFSKVCDQNGDRVSKNSLLKFTN